MDISLFSQGPTLFLCALSTALVMYLILHVSYKLRHRGLPFVLLGGVILAALFEWTVGRVTKSGDELPPRFWLMILPSTFTIVLVAAIPIVRHFFRDKTKTGKPKKIPPMRKRTRLILYGVAAAGIISTVLFSGVLINTYYHFYPTLYAALNIDQGRPAYNDSTDTSLFVSSKDTQKVYNRVSIQAAVANTTNNKTNGTLYSVRIPGTVSGFKARAGWVYVPAIAAKTMNKLNLPVLVLLPGVPGSPKDWVDAGGLVQTMNNFAKSHHGITPLVVVVDDTGSTFNDTECVNSPRGNVETYLTKDVPTYIKAHFAVSTSPSNWAIGGVSMGGMCSVMLTLRHPNIYSHFVDISGEAGPEVGSQKTTIKALFAGSKTAWAAHQPALLLQSHTYNHIGGFFTYGTQDDTKVVNGTNELYTFSKKAGLDTAFDIVGSGHNFNTFNLAFKDVLPWISNRIGATECSDNGCYSSPVADITTTTRQPQ